jgi:hypothetical protein
MHVELDNNFSPAFNPEVQNAGRFTSMHPVRLSGVSSCKVGPEVKL